MMLLAEPAGGSLERTGNRASRGMIVHDRTRLIGQLLLNISRIKSGFGQMIANSVQLAVRQLAPYCREQAGVRVSIANKSQMTL
jgi:hypothetical protein